MDYEEIARLQRAAAQIQKYLPDAKTLEAMQQAQKLMPDPKILAMMQQAQKHMPDSQTLASIHQFESAMPDPETLAQMRQVASSIPQIDTRIFDILPKISKTKSCQSEADEKNNSYIFVGDFGGGTTDISFLCDLESIEGDEYVYNHGLLSEGTDTDEGASLDNNEERTELLEDIKKEVINVVKESSDITDDDIIIVGSFFDNVIESISSMSRSEWLSVVSIILKIVTWLFPMK